MLRIHVTDGEQLGLGVDGFEVSLAHAPDTNDGLGQDFAGRGHALSAQNVAGDDVDGGERQDGSSEELAASELKVLFHDGRVHARIGGRGPEEIIPFTRRELSPACVVKWEDLVWSAKAVNQRKADRLPHEGGLKRLSSPRAPKELPVTALIRNAHGVADWRLFVQDKSEA